MKSKLLLGVLLATLVLSSITATAFSWLQVGVGAGTGALAGGIVGSVIPGIGTLIGAGVGALTGAIASIVNQLIFSAPTSSSNITVWSNFEQNAYNQLYSQSIAIADNEINTVNVMKESSAVYVITAQKYEQVNYNANVSPTSPKQFYALLENTGFLQNAFQEIGAPQELWVEAQGQMYSIDNLTYAHTNTIIQYNVNPCATVYSPYLSGEYLIIVQGNVTVIGSPGSTVTMLCDNGVPENQPITPPYTLSTGYYVLNFGNIEVAQNPKNGASLLFQYTGSSYSLDPIPFNEPTLISMNGVMKIIPSPSINPTALAESIANQMLASAEVEYTTLKDLGFKNSSQIPSNFQLPTINLNVPLNFTNVTSLQEYNLLMSEYIQYLLTINNTLTTLAEQGKLQGLKNLTFNFASPLQVYGQEGGFVFIGYIQTPQGTIPNGTYLIQPYGSPLTLTSTGGTIPSGGALMYILIKTPNGYALGNYSILPPGSVLYGKVLNPGTLYPVTQPQSTSPLPSVNFVSPVSTSSAISQLKQYLLSHPLILLITIFFGLIILVAILRTLF